MRITHIIFIIHTHYQRAGRVGEIMKTLARTPARATQSTTLPLYAKGNTILYYDRYFELKFYI